MQHYVNTTCNTHLARRFLHTLSPSNESALAAVVLWVCFSCVAVGTLSHMPPEVRIFGKHVCSMIHPYTFMGNIFDSAQCASACYAFE